MFLMVMLEIYNFFSKFIFTSPLLRFFEGFLSIYVHHDRTYKGSLFCMQKSCQRKNWQI